MLIERLPAGPRDRGRRLARDGRGGARGAAPGRSLCICDLTELELRRAGRRGLLQRRLPLDPRPRRALRTDAGGAEAGRQFAAQCGGAGNIEEFRAVSEAVAARDPYASDLRASRSPGSTPGRRRPKRACSAAGFAEVRCWLEPWDVVPPEPSEFMRHAVLKPQSTVSPRSSASASLTDVLSSQRGAAAPRLRAPQHRSHRRLS